MLIPFRLLALGLVTLLAVPGFVAVAGLGLLGLQRQRMQFAAHIQSVWSRAVLLVLGIRLETHGQKPPLKASIVAANHLSYIDVLVLSALFPSRFIGKSEIASWPVLGQLVALAGTLFVKRGDRNDVPRVVSEMGRTLDAGVSVTFFPEGWASRGLTVGRFHPGLFQAAVQGGFPCLPVAISYSTPVEHFAPAWTVAWWGPVPIGPHVLRMLRQGPVVASLRWAPEVMRGEDRKVLASSLEGAVRERFSPLRQEPVPPPITGDPAPHEGLLGPLAESSGATYT